MRLIDADVLAKEINEMPCYCTTDIQHVLYKIIDTPTFDLEKAGLQRVKHGKWFDVGSLSCRCDQCGCKNNKETLYCPNCGAKMDGE